MVLTIGGIAYYHYVYVPRKNLAASEVEYVLPEALPVIDTTAEVRRVVATLHSGQPVRVTSTVDEWSKLLLADGQSGWVHGRDLLDAQTYGRDQELLKQEESSPAQAAGHINTIANVHLTASRVGVTVGQLSTDQRVEVYDRRLVNRPALPGSGSGKTAQDVWYLIRGGHSAGWVLGDFVSLDVPQGLAEYAQGINLVAWMPLDTVDDNGQEIPQYLAADRIGRRNVDFNHIRVFTWWVKHHKYVTAYVESHLDGYFPITVTHTGNVPYFRLRLVDEGRRYQKVYGLYDTIVRPIGTVDGWTSTAMPAPAVSRLSLRSRRLRRRDAEPGEHRQPHR
jgi:Bacterial SH3 domain